MIELKKIREKKGFTYAKMAKLLNISSVYYWQIENDKRKLSYLMAVKISNIFKLKPDDIFYKDFKSKN